MHCFTRTMNVSVRELGEHRRTHAGLFLWKVGYEEMVEASIEPLPTFLNRHRCAVLFFPVPSSLRPALHPIRAAHVPPGKTGPVGGAQILEDIGRRLAQIHHVTVDAVVVADSVTSSRFRHPRPRPPSRQRAAEEPAPAP